MILKYESLHYFCYKDIKSQTLGIKLSSFVFNITVIALANFVKKNCSTVGPL